MYDQKAFHDMLFLVIEGRKQLKRQPEVDEADAIQGLCRNLGIPYDQKILEATLPSVTNSGNVQLIAEKSQAAWERYQYLSKLN